MPDAGLALERRRSYAGSLLGFFSLTFVVTWACFIAAVLVSAGSQRAPLRPGVSALILLGTFAPSLVALGFTTRAEGGEGVRALLGSMFKWRVSARWYVFAVAYMIAIKLTVALVHRLAAGAWPHLGESPVYLMLAATVLSTAIGGQSGEEIGWRGYALPRLAARFGLGGASIMLGVF